MGFKRDFKGKRPVVLSKSVPSEEVGDLLIGFEVCGVSAWRFGHREPGDIAQEHKGLAPGIGS